MNSDRITRKLLDNAVDNLNRRMQHLRSKWRYMASHRYDYYALDKIYADGSGSRGAIRTGTKKELYEYAQAMMNALDDASEKR